MARFVGIKNNRICVVSDGQFSNPGLNVIEVPKELADVSSTDLVVNCYFRNGSIRCRCLKKPASQIKIAFVSNYGTKCGIGTYSKSLYDELINLVGDYRLFIEKQDHYEVEDPKIPEEKIVPCWKRGESLLELSRSIKEYDPDIVLIQHEFGLFPHARCWLSLMTQLLEYRVIVTMHSVFPHHKDKSIYEAAMPEIIVHLSGAKDNLINEKKIKGKVHVIPHGCYPIITQDKLWNTYRSDHTFIQQGFAFEYKNFEASIKAAAILKDKFPDVFFTALFSQSDYNMVGHTVYFNRLMDLVDEFSLHENVAIIRGYQSDNIIDSYLRTNQVGVFPYLSVPGHSVFGASGAARMAMAAGLPIISSSIPHFSDLPTIKADTPEQIAEALDRLFSSEELKKKQVEKQNQFIITNSWANIAKQYIAVFES